jgi:hypothetical protein
MGMSALLMPKEVFVLVVRHSRATLSLPDGAPSSGSQDARALTEEIARRFSVSKQAAWIRLLSQGVVVAAAQGSLVR